MLRHKILTLIISIASFLTVFAFILVPRAEAYSGGEAWDNLNGYILEYENDYWYSDTDFGLVNLSENPELVRSLLLGINNDNLNKIKSKSSDTDLLLAARLSGKFLLAVEERGQLWYVNPSNLELQSVDFNDLTSLLAENSIKLADFGSYAQDDWTSRLLVLVNNYRIENNLEPLQLDPDLGAIAYDKAKEMFIENYFAHIGPNSLSPGQRLNNFSYPWFHMGENLAIGRAGILDPETVFSMWLASPGHKANILKADYTHIGLAFYNNFWVQEFVQR